MSGIVEPVHCELSSPKALSEAPCEAPYGRGRGHTYHSVHFSSLSLFGNGRLVFGERARVLLSDAVARSCMASMFEDLRHG